MAASKLTLESTLLLNDGLRIPLLGLGTYLAEGRKGIDAVDAAIKVGYRHFDSAQFYRNEKEVGQAVLKSGIPREQIWITSKVWDVSHGYEPCLRSIDKSLSEAGVEYFDLMLLHSPNPGKVKRLEAWRALIEAKKAGKLKSIGVSNYGPHHIQELLQAFPDHPPSVNQIELSPYFQRSAIVDECKKHNIAIESYSPLGKGAFVDLPELKEIADKYKATPSQVLIRWCLQRGFIVLPKSSNAGRIAENANVYFFNLSDEDMKTLDGFETGSGITWDPTTAP